MSTDNFPRMLRRARLSTGLTIVQVAERVGVTHATVSRWENGHSLPKYEHAEALDKLLGTDGELVRGWRVAASGSPVAPWEVRRSYLHQESHTIGWASSHMIPGYLQSSAYTHLILRNTVYSGTEHELRKEVSRRSRRYDEMRQKCDPWAIAVFPEISLACLPEKIREEQARLILDRMENGRLEVQLIGSDTHIPLVSILHVYHLRAGGIVAVSEANQGTYVHDDPKVAFRLNELFNLVGRMAYSKAESRDILQEMS